MTDGTKFWMDRYDAVVKEKQSLGEKLGVALYKNNNLQQQLDRLKNSLSYTALKNMEMENCRLKEENKDLQQKNNELTSSNEAIRSINSSMSRSLSSSMHQAKELEMQLKQKEEENAYLDAQLKDMIQRVENITLSLKIVNERLDNAIADRKELKKQLEAKKNENESLHNVIDSFVDKCTGLEAKAEGYKKELEEKIELLNSVQDRFTKADLKAQLEDLTQLYENTRLSLRIVNERLDKSNADRAELQADRDFYFRKHGEKLAEIEELKRKVKHAEKQLEENKHSYEEGYSDGNEEGQNELWEMLQVVKDMGPNEVDPECDCLGDVIDMDLEDFKEAYGKWEAEQQKKVAEEAKKQHIEHMRSYLKKYCIGHMCTNCPLHDISSSITSCLFSKLTDEEVEKRYRKAIESKLEEKEEVPVSARLPQPWECTVEINEDILKVVCGIKDDKNNK